VNEESYQMIPSIRVIKYQHTLDGVQARHINLPLSRSVVAERLQKAVMAGREGYTPNHLAALDAGTLSVEVVQALFTPAEIQNAVERRKKALAQEVATLDRLVPRAEAEMLVSRDRKVVDDADETGDWHALADYDAREMGGDGTTRRSQEKLNFERSLQALRDAADLLK
jgi:hypothetical protein